MAIYLAYISKIILDLKQATVSNKVLQKIDAVECHVGYMFNIKMLKVIFAPEFQLHDIRYAVSHFSQFCIASSYSQNKAMLTVHLLVKPG